MANGPCDMDFVDFVISGAFYIGILYRYLCNKYLTAHMKSPASLNFNFETD